MLEVPPEWNEVPDLVMEDEDVLPEAAVSTKRKQDEVAWGRRNVDIRPQYLGEYKIQKDSFLKIGMKFSRKKTNGKHQISGNESYGWCFVVEV